MSMKQTADRILMAALLVACILAAAVSFASMANAKGQEGGVVCTGTQMAARTCEPKPLSSTPIGSIPLGCKPSSGETVACGRAGPHRLAAAEGQRARGPAVGGPTQAFATPATGRSGVTATAQPQAGRHAAR